VEEPAGLAGIAAEEAAEVVGIVAAGAVADIVEVEGGNLEAEVHFA
jgi:L-serine deaminase